MNALARRIARMIETDGPIGVGTFMTLALHDREAGFYATRQSIGAGGAFITAPEMTQVFGELIALWCAACWRGQGSPAAPLLVELGPGRGTLVKDMLRALRSAPDFLRALEIVLVESSPRLQSEQRRRLSGCGVPVRWVPQWYGIEPGRPLFLVANEFFDALPIRQFVMTKDGWRERVIVTRGAALSFGLSSFPVSPPCTGRNVAHEGAVYEICPAGASLAQDIGRAVAQDGGAALLIDYGYAAQPGGDTLRAVRNHERADVLASPGEADLSAHVDFCALATAARQGGARVHGPLLQGDFLRSLGIDLRGAQLARANPQRSDEVAGAIARLTDPEAMGTLFKVLAVVPPDAPVPAGYA